MTIEEELSYRTPMRVNAMQMRRLLVGSNSYTSYPICPRCNHICGIEYQNYCGHCGQALKWYYYNRAKKIYT